MYCGESQPAGWYPDNCEKMKKNVRDNYVLLFGGKCRPEKTGVDNISIFNTYSLLLSIKSYL